MKKWITTRPKIMQTGKISHDIHEVGQTYLSWTVCLVTILPLVSN